MVIYFYGRHTHNYNSNRPKDIVCHNCNAQSQTLIKKYVRYIHIHYVPLFSYKFWTEYECVSCKHIADKNQLSRENKNKYKSFNTKSLLPIWTFSGLIVLLAIPITIWGFSIKNKQDMLSRIDNLQINQKIDYKMENGNYSMFKISKLEEENISIIYNTLETSTENSLIGIDYQKNYSKDTLILNATELKDWVRNDKIIFISK